MTATSPKNGDSEEREDDRAPAEQRADEHEQLGVAVAHALALEDEVGELGGDGDDAVADGHAEQQIERRHVAQEEPATKKAGIAG